MRDVAIVAAGMTRFGELWGASLRDLFVEAAREALTHAGAERLDAIYVGNMSAGQFVGQEHLGPLMAGELGMSGIPATRVESACASGGVALRSAFLEVASGMSDLVMAAGVEKMNDGSEVTDVLATAADQELEGYTESPSRASTPCWPAPIWSATGRPKKTWPGFRSRTTATARRTRRRSSAVSSRSNR